MTATKTPGMALRDKILKRLQRIADDAFDEEEAIDSDGYDQAERDGVLSAMAVVEDEFRSYLRKEQRERGGYDHH